MPYVYTCSLVGLYYRTFLLFIAVNLEVSDSTSQCNALAVGTLALAQRSKGKGLGIGLLVIALLTCMSRLEHQRFTISEVAADWHELMIYRGALCGHALPAIANKWTRGAAHIHTTAPIRALGLHPVARKLLLISRPAEGRRLSWPAT